MKKLILFVLLIPTLCFAQLPGEPTTLKILAEAYDYLQVKIIALMIGMVIIIILNVLILYKLYDKKK